MVDQNVKKLEDFGVAIASGNPVLLPTVDAKDVMATMRLLSPEEMWDKLATDYAAVSASMAAIARSRFHDFRMRDGDTTMQTQHRFDYMVN